jgi:hypothetical protein
MSLLMPLRAFGLIHDATMVGPSMIRPIQVGLLRSASTATPPIPTCAGAHHSGFLAAEITLRISR